MFCSVEEAIDEIKNGKVIIVVDDEDRENEGDFICAAEYVTPDIVNFMVTHGEENVVRCNERNDWMS